MPIYELQIPLIDRNSIAGIEGILSHAFELRGVLSAVSISGGRMRFTVNPALPANQLAHLNLTLV